MTREEAIEVIKQDIPCEHDTDLIEALEMAITALEQEPKIVPIAEIKFDDDMLHEIVEEAVKNIEIEPKWIQPSVNPQEPCEDEITLKFTRGALKSRQGDMVIYNVAWLREHWQMEMDIVCGVKPCDDAISREELLKAINTWDRFGVDDTNSLFRLDNLSLPHYVPYIHYDDVIKSIKGMPPVNPQPKTGCWAEIDEEPHEVWECDHCGFVIDGSGCIDPYDYRDTYNFCPNCGACMKDGRTLDEFIEDSKE